MAGVSRWVAGLSRKKQVGLALVALWLSGFTVSHIPGIGGSGTKAQARPAVSVASRPVRWGGITKAQALRLVVRDEYVEELASGSSATPADAADWANSAVGDPKVVTRVKCHGSEFWKLDYGDLPAPDYESEDVRIGGECDSVLWVAHPARLACVSGKEWWNAHTSDGVMSWWKAKRIGLRRQSEWHRQRG